MQNSIALLFLVALSLGTPAPVAGEIGREVEQEDTLESVLPLLEHPDAVPALVAALGNIGGEKGGRDGWPIPRDPPPSPLPATSRSTPPGSHEFGISAG